MAFGCQVSLVESYPVEDRSSNDVLQRLHLPPFITGSYRPEADIRYLSPHPLDQSGADLKRLLATTRSIDEKPEVQFSLILFSGMPA